MLAQFKVVKIVDVSVMPTGMLLGRSNLPGNSPESEIQIERKNVTDASAHAHNLRTHLIMNTGEKSNKCIQCDYASSEASKLVRHLKTHSGEKSDKCNQ